MSEIEVGFRAYVSDASDPLGVVEDVSRDYLVVRVRRADFIVARTAVAAVRGDAVVLECGRLDHLLRRAIGHAHPPDRTRR